MTSPCVASATVGMFFETLGVFNSVFWTSETYRSSPKPLIRVSYFPSLPNFPNDNILIKDCKFSFVKAFSLSKAPSGQFCSHQVTANNVTDRKMLPFDHVTTSFLCSSVNFCRSFETVVPFPVPDNPHKTMTELSPFAMNFKISSATVSGVLPRTSILTYGSGSKFGSMTPFDLAKSIPRWSFTPSSSSRANVAEPSASANALKPAESFQCSISALEVSAFC
mmetsp:Transcript_32777/g.79690  ORF Transcript_32777/g.79690 Transcript_32777/m.79690 type:complete len:222 (-) Transcript_32777:366-1031(-)